MPLTKQYLTYKAECRYGVIAGRKGGALLTRGKGERLLAISPALEDVNLWEIRTNRVVGELKGGDVEVCVLCLSCDGTLLGVGLEDGSVVLWDILKQTSRVTLNGHRSAITCLHFNSTHTQLVSGSKDTHVIVWDTVSEAGLFRLKGHKGPLTECRFLSSLNILITSSRDGLVKLWDLDTQHCFQTLVSHDREVWSFAVVGKECGEGGDVGRLVVTSGDTQPKVYQLTRQEFTESKVPVVATVRGTLKLSCNDRLTMVKTDPNQQYLACLCLHDGVELYRLRGTSDLEQLLKKRRKKAAKKKSEGTEEEVTLSVKDEFKFVCSFKGSGKHRSVDLMVTAKGQLMVLLTLQNNSLELYGISADSAQQLYSIVTPGHRTDVRTVSLSSDNSRILSASAKQVKIWNRSTQQCVSTLASKYALCSTFLPGDRHALIGTKSGQVQLFDLSSSSLLEEVAAHDKAVWALSLFPDQRGVATGSADHSVKFWEFEMMSAAEDSQGGKRLTLSLVRTLKLSEDVLGVCHSANGRLLAVALMDSTIKVFFTDTLKFFLSLYGHKLPVLSMDISSDSTLLVTCSADKNIRIWGLDFGDCHKSIFAHSDSIMAVQFVPDTHLLFSASKDTTIKCWDADNFQQIQTLKGHHGEVWCLAISKDGDTVVSGSHDLSIRVWERTMEPLVLSEQQELEREAFMDELSAAENLSERVIPGEVSGELSLPPARSKEALTAVDRLLESLVIYEEERAKLEEHRKLCASAGKQLAPPRPHPMLVAKGDIQAEKYVLEVVKGIKSSELEECLLVMPFDQMLVFLKLADYWLQRGWEVELVCRCLFFLLRVHHMQITSSQVLLSTLDSLAQHSTSQITHLKDVYGENLAGLEFLKRELGHKGTRVFEDAPTLLKKKRKRTYGQ